MLPDKMFPNEPIVFSIEKRTYSRLKESGQDKLRKGETPTKDDWEDVPFGPRYAGNFKFRVPNLFDQAEVAKKVALRLASQGPVDPVSLDLQMRTIEYTFSLAETCAEEKPPWFDITRLWTPQDRLAVVEVNYAFNETLSEVKKKFEEVS